MKKYMILIISLFFAALNFNLFLKPLNLVTGGNQGIAIILKHITDIEPSLIVLIINAIALILSFIFLKKETSLSTIIAAFSYPLFLKLTANIPTPTIINIPIITSIIAGIICGLTGGIIYKLNFSQGGISILNNILHHYTNLKISISNFIINTIIIVIGSLYFGFTKLLYSLIVITISSMTINLIMSKKNNDII